MALSVADGVMRSYTILFGNPGNRRTTGWQQALQYHGQPAALEVPYIRLLQAIRAGDRLIDLLESLIRRQDNHRLIQTDSSFPFMDKHGLAGNGKAAESAPPVSLDNNEWSDHRMHMDNDEEKQGWTASQLSGLLTLRLDAPGENIAVERGLIALGADDAEGWIDDDLLPLPAYTQGSSISAMLARRLEPYHGRVLYPAQWFRGWCRLLSWLHVQVQRDLPHASWMNDPAEAAIMFDKRRCSNWLDQAGVKVPGVLASSYTEMPNSYDSLRQLMERRQVHRVFVKLFCGSGASGVIAYQYHPRTGAEIASTTVGIEQWNGETVIYNSGRLRRYTDHGTIRQIMDWVGQEGMHVERWISKDMLDGKAYDIRQLVCGAQAGHAVVRLSRTPITNLHLRNERMLLEQTGLSAAIRENIRTTALAGLAAFPGSFCAGMDVLVPAGGGMPLIADVNPFGDLLYYVQHQEMGAYEWELARWLERN
ncbi:STM4014 family protein [Paenibacillus shenyangensis]|uniref:STM4014 family protein n=1 Tax=Paenibacillus sp. A9 TaxID=1284352 RepID=UPI00126808C9